jgi:hypothetical protein
MPVMDYKPVVSQHENVVILICPSCENSGFYCIERFIDEDAQRDINRLVEKGYVRKNLPLRSASAIDDCNCLDVDSEEAPAPAQAQLFKKRKYTLPSSGRPLLSLRRKTA